MVTEHYRLFCMVLSQRFVEPEGEEDYSSFKFMNQYKGHHAAIKALQKMTAEEQEKVYEDMERVHNAALSVFDSFPPRLIFTLRYSAVQYDKES